MSRAEIRTYEGDGSDLAELEQRVWKDAFQGRAWFPLWDQAYFDWRILDPRAGGRDLCVAAYEGTKLVGCILAEMTEFQVSGRNVPGSYSSWLAVDREARSRGLALRLAEELRNRHRARDLMLSIGCTRSDPESGPRKFWGSLAQRYPQEYQFWGPIRFWASVLNPRAVAAAGLSVLERWGPHALRLIPSIRLRSDPASGVRPFVPADLPACLRLIEAHAKPADIRMVWNPSRLELQLGHAKFPRTLVAEGDAGPVGFLNYYPLRWSGACELRVAMIDLFAGDGHWLLQRQLLKSAQRQMREEGVDLVLMMMSAAAPAGLLVSRGFVPIDPHAESFGLFIDPRLELHQPRRFHILFT